MLVELAVGDAYGSAFEYSSLAHIEKHNTGVYYTSHPRHKKIPPGFYTDDTQMTLAIVETMLSSNPWDAATLADAFVKVFHRDPRTGYSGSFYKFLLKTKTGKEFLANIDPSSDKSGAAMRTTPLGLYSSIDEVRLRTIVQAAITHNSVDGIAAAEAASLLVYYCHKNLGPVKDVGKWINSVLVETSPNDWSVPWRGKVKTKGWMSVRAAITAVARNDNLSDLLMDSVAFTGDVDTVATIALAAASVSKQYEKNLPDSLVMSLEDRGYGLAYLEKLDAMLNEKFGVKCD